MSDRYLCPVCGAVSRRPEDLCEARPTDGRCEATVRPTTPPPESAQRQRVMQALEILFCPSVYERARYSCEACGRLAMDEGLVCLPHKRKQ